MNRRKPDQELLGESKRDWQPDLWQCATCETRGDKLQDLFYRSGDETFCPTCAKGQFYICPACGELIPWEDVDKQKKEGKG